MAFPLSNVLDDFNRANESPPSGWPNNAYAPADGDLSVIGNQLGSAGAWGNSVYGTQMAEDFEASITIASVAGAPTAQFLWLVRLTNPGTPSVTGYGLGVIGGNWFITRIDNSTTFVTLRASGTPSLADGDQIGVRCINSALELWHRPAATGVWGKVEEVNSGSYVSPGYMGFEIENTGWRLDNLLGPAVAVAGARKQLLMGVG